MTLPRESFLPSNRTSLTSEPNKLIFLHASEVRRAAIFNLEPAPSTLPALLGRSRDADTLNRKAVFVSPFLNELPDPKILNAKQREILMRNGLKDREASVRRAASSLVAKWIGLAEDDLMKVSPTSS